MVQAASSAAAPAAPQQAGGRGRDALLVSVGMLVTSLVGGLQSVLILAVSGADARTDGFMAAYAVYAPMALIGVSLRRSLVPLFGPSDTDEFPARVSSGVRAAAWLAVFVMLALMPLAPVMGELLAGEQDAARRAATTTLLLLIPAAALHVCAGSLSAVLNALRLFPRSVGLYVGSSCIALAVSAVLIPLVGPLGAAVAVVFAATILAGRHLREVSRVGIRRVRRGTSGQPGIAPGKLAVAVATGSALVVAQQLNLAQCLAAIDAGQGIVTIYANAFFIASVVVNISATPLSLVTLPDFVASAAHATRAQTARQLARQSALVLALAVPVLALIAAVGAPLLRIPFGGALAAGELSLLHDLLVLFAAWTVPAALAAQVGAVMLTRGRWLHAGAVAVAAVLAQAVALRIVGDRAETVALTHIAVMWGTVGALVAVTFGRDALAYVGGVLRGIAPVLLAALPILAVAALGLGDDGIVAALLLGAAGAAVYALLLRAVAPQLTQPFLALARRGARA